MKTIQCVHPPHHDNGFAATCRLWTASGGVRALLVLDIDLYTKLWLLWIDRYIDRQTDRHNFTIISNTRSLFLAIHYLLFIVERYAVWSILMWCLVFIDSCRFIPQRTLDLLAHSVPCSRLCQHTPIFSSICDKYWKASTRGVLLKKTFLKRSYSV